MTPKEKAKVLIDLMESQTYSYQEYAGAYESVAEIGYEAGKKCALILTNEMIEFSSNKCCEFQNVKYWEEVKQEIEKL